MRWIVALALWGGLRCFVGALLLAVGGVIFLGAMVIKDFLMFIASSWLLSGMAASFVIGLLICDHQKFKRTKQK